MIYRRLDQNGDMNFGHGRGDFITDREALGQAVLTRLKWLYNEWWEKIGTGFPLFQQALTYGPSQQKLDLLYSDWIRGTKGVTGVQSLASRVDNRRYHMSCVVNTVYGDLSINYPLNEPDSYRRQS
jgi:hypothetical protein